MYKELKSISKRRTCTSIELVAREGERTINTTGRLVRKKIALLVIKEGRETKIKQLVHAEYLSAKTRQSNWTQRCPFVHR